MRPLNTGAHRAAQEWILVAGATQASLFALGQDGRLVALEDFREAPADRLAPDPARQVGGPSPRRLRQLRFATRLTSRLEQGLAEGRCGRVSLLAACPFLGALRKSLSPAGRRAVHAMVSADLVGADDQRILGALAAAESDGAD